MKTDSLHVRQKIQDRGIEQQLLFVSLCPFQHSIPFDIYNIANQYHIYHFLIYYVGSRLSGTHCTPYTHSPSLCNLHLPSTDPNTITPVTCQCLWRTTIKGNTPKCTSCFWLRIMLNLLKRPKIVRSISDMWTLILLSMPVHPISKKWLKIEMPSL